MTAIDLLKRVSKHFWADEPISLRMFIDEIDKCIAESDQSEKPTTGDYCAMLNPNFESWARKYE